ncbi:MAG: autotransporter outer membrane beta-barrel domain-containing protein [Sutterellaceae bacterium]|nr:autotransporter outer membrane beta-barrel domain-containing protein [Sutterellaceae bacterium]
MGLNNGAQWNATDTSFVNNLNVQDGVINLTKGDGQTVNVDKMTGSNATVNVAATTDDGQTFKTAKLSITRNDVTEYNLSFTGVTADDVKNADAAFAALSASIEAGTDPSSVKIKQNNTIAEGAVRGEMKQTVDENGKKSEVEVSRNTRLTAFESISAMPMLSLRHELNSLNKRMGELRDSPAGIGSWVRLYGSETEYGAQSIESKNTTIQVGSDVSVGDWKVGLAAHYTDGESTYANGQSDSKDYGIALYGTWLAPSGAYVDMIAKYTRIDTDFALNGMDGNYDNNAFTASVEAGYRFNLMDNRVFVEPQVELSYGYVTSTDFTTGNDVRIQQDSFESTIGRIGVRTGYTFPNNKGSVYARVSGVYDFQGEMTGTAALVSDATVREALKEDLGGSWVEYGVGANFNWSDNTYMYVDLERTSSGEVRENYRWNVGLRHVW